MKWIRGEIPDNVSKTTSDVYKDFFESQDLTEKNTPIIDEGLQNSIDAKIQNEIPKIKISHVKISKEFFNKFIGDDFMSWNKDSMIIDSYVLEQQLKKNYIECLLFEDFNTTGVKGNPDIYKTRLEDGSRNDFHIFLYYVGAPAAEKDKSKGGSVGVGRLAFAFSSKINTFFMYTNQEGNPEKNHFIGLSNFGKDKKNSAFDPIARYGNEGKSPKGLPIAESIKSKDELKKIREGFKLARQTSDAGTSMIVPLPREEITYDSLIVNAISRYRYGIYHGHFELEIGNKIINKSTILDVVKSKFSAEDYERYVEYFKFLDGCAEIDQKKNFITIDTSQQANPSRIKSEFFTDKQLEKLSDDYKNERIIAAKLPVTIKKKVEDDVNKKEDTEDVPTFIHIFLKRTSVKYGMDDIMRGPMSVAGERKLEGLDVFGLNLIRDDPIHEFCRKLESPNHRVFTNANQEFNKNYDGYRHQRALLTSALEALRTLIIEKDSEFSSEASKDFFSFGDPDDRGRDKEGDPSKTDTDGVTKFNLPIGLFENPKAYNISKIHSKELAGFNVKSNDLKQSCKETIDKINKFIDENKERKEFTKKIERRLNNQKNKLSSWMEGKNLKDLYPAKIFIKCAEDVEGVGDTSYGLHDNEHDFDLSNNIKHEIQQEKAGNIEKVEISGNKIDITVNGPEFFYQLKTDAFLIKKTNEHADLRFAAYMRTID